MMRFFKSAAPLFLALSLFAWRASAADRITATLAVTNVAGTTNGQTVTINGSVRIWTNNVVLVASQVLTNSTAAGAKTNLYNQLALNPSFSVAIVDRSSTNFDLVGASGVALTVSLSVGWGTVTYATQAVTSLIPVRVPISGEPSGPQQTNIASQLVKDQNTLSTNSFYENSTVVVNLVGLTNNQTISGIKLYTNAAGQWKGIISNSPAISGVAVAISNGVFWLPKLASPTISNATVYGLVADSVGVNTTVGFGGFASTITANGNYFTVQPEAANGITIGLVGFYNGVLAYDVFATNKIHALTLESTNTAHYGQTVFGATNTFPAGADIAFGRYANSSLANGNNAGVVVGTNVFVDLSGPSAAFVINGIAGGRDGKEIRLENLTGQNLTIAHDSGVEPTAANRIYTMTGADQATTGNGFVVLIYNATVSRWIVESFNP